MVWAPVDLESGCIEFFEDDCSPFSPWASILTSTILSLSYPTTGAHRLRNSGSASCEVADPRFRRIVDIAVKCSHHFRHFVHVDTKETIETSIRYIKSDRGKEPTENHYQRKADRSHGRSSLETTMGLHFNSREAPALTHFIVSRALLMSPSASTISILSARCASTILVR